MKQYIYLFAFAFTARVHYRCSVFNKCIIYYPNCSFPTFKYIINNVISCNLAALVQTFNNELINILSSGVSRLLITRQTGHVGLIMDWCIKQRGTDMDTNA